jgi:hypothetical protein
MLQRVLLIFFVALALTVWASAPTRAADIHQGKVVEVGAGKLTMADMAGKSQHSNGVATNAAITCEGKKCGLSDVKVGNMVTVTTDTKDGKTMATKIEATKAGS